MKPTLRPGIERAMWEKFVLLAVGAGMACLMRGSVGTFVATDGGEALTLKVLEESAAVAAVEGPSIDAEALGKIRHAVTSAALRDHLDATAAGPRARASTSWATWSAAPRCMACQRPCCVPAARLQVNKLGTQIGG